jgi:hypothetical protein
LQGKGSINSIPPFGARQRLGKHVPAANNTRNNKTISGRVIFYAVRVLSKVSLSVCLCKFFPELTVFFQNKKSVLIEIFWKAMAGNLSDTKLFCIDGFPYHEANSGRTVLMSIFNYFSYIVWPKRDLGGGGLFQAWCWDIFVSDVVSF